MKAHENPFSASAVARLRYRIDKNALRSLAEKACAQPALCAVVGPEGTGKTTLLEDLQTPLSEMGRNIIWIRLNRESTPSERRAAKSLLTELRENDCCLLDGGEVFSAWEWWHFKRRLKQCEGLIVASLHRSRGIPVLYQTAANWALVQHMVRELAGSAANEVLDRVARESFLANAGNAREVFRSCYWACASR